MDGMNWFVYCVTNPLRYVDLNGLQPVKKFAGTVNDFKHFANRSRTKIGLASGAEAGLALARLGERGGFLGLEPQTTPYFNEKKGRFIYTTREGWIDMCHFLFYAGRAYAYKQANAKDPVFNALHEGYMQEFYDQFRAP